MDPQMRRPVRLVLPMLVAAVSALIILAALAGPVVAAATTPTPTPAAVQAVASGPVATISSAVANVRSGPGTGYPLLGQAKKGQQLPITGRNAASSWWQVDYKGKPGWIAASLAQAGPGAAQVKVVAAPPLACTGGQTRGQTRDQACSLAHPCRSAPASLSGCGHVG